MKRLLLIIAICISTLSFGQQADFEWAKAFGSTNFDHGVSITVDEFGNVYTTGVFAGTVDFDTGIGSFNLTSAAGSADVFIQKLDASGNFIWAKSFGSTSNDIGYSITVDGLGNVYATGIFSGTVDFDPGAGSFNLTSTGNHDVFVQKLDASGNFIWAKAFGSGSNDFGLSITVDGLGNVYTTGLFSETVDFDPGTGLFYHTSEGFGDVFVQKLDASGNFIWAKAVGSTFDDRGLSITVDSSGNVYATGYFQGTVDFDPGVGSFNHTSTGNNDVFIQKLDAAGDFIWAKAVGSTNIENGYSIAVDPSGNVYTTGYFQGTLDFDPGAGIFNITSAGNYDAFIQKLDASGNFLWAKAVGSTLDDRGYSMTVDASGNVYATGVFSDTVDFDPGAGTFNLTSAGVYDVFVQKLDAAGNFIWAKAFGSNSNDQGSSIAVNTSGNVYTTGYFSGTVDFDTGAGTFNLTGSYDVFVHKINQCTVNTGIDVQTACDSYQWIDGQTYTASNNSATFNLTNVAGCDSTVTLNLTITNSNTGSEILTECDSYTWNTNGETYTQSGQYTEVLSNQNGCDSTVTLDLTITNSSTGSEIVTECDSYTWNTNGQTYTESGQYTEVLSNQSGCDSTVTLDLTITNSSTGSEIVTECDSYTWNTNGQTYTESGQYTEVLSNQSGCDSTVTLDLTINTSSSSTQTETGIESYTWSVNNQTYTESGTYTAVIPNASGCDSTITLDLTLQFTGLDEDESSYVTVYPNPTYNSFTLSTKNMINMNYTLVDIQGKVVFIGKIESSEEIVDISKLSRGEYNLVFEDESIGQISIIKN